MSNNCQKDCGLYDQYVIYNKALEYAMKLESNAVKSSEEEAILGHQINDYKSRLYTCFKHQG